MLVCPCAMVWAISGYFNPIPVITQMISSPALINLSWSICRKAAMVAADAGSAKTPSVLVNKLTASKIALSETETVNPFDS